MRNSDLTERERAVLNGAVMFTAVRGLLANRVRHDCSSLEEAERIAEGYGDKRTMIYAVDAMGGQAHIKNA